VEDLEDSKTGNRQGGEEYNSSTIIRRFFGGSDSSSVKKIGGEAWNDILFSKEKLGGESHL